MTLSAEGNIITAPQIVTDVWATMGAGNIETIGYSFFTPYIDITINDSKDVQFRFRLSYESGIGEPLYIFPAKEAKKIGGIFYTDLDDFRFRLKNNIDQHMPIPIDLDSTVKIIELQVMAGTVGITPAVIDKARYRQGYRQ